MTFRGTVRNGRVELEAGTELPEGTEVRIEPVTTRKAEKKVSKRRGSVDAAFRLSDLAIPMGVKDLASEHNHYLYGTPKRVKPKRSVRAKSQRSGRRT